ncbi:MAG: glycosyltransferase family 39 protein, partial [Dialister sp.]|nr:glycosyltransferase family 39 protein [Dialister sp.]
LSKAGRDPRWNSKSPIPSITEDDFLKMETDRPVYIYVSDSNLEEMKKWSSGKQFVVDKKLPYGTVFKKEP